MELRLTLPLPTSINALYINKATYNPKTKKYVPTGERILSKEGQNTKALIRKQTKQQMKNQTWDFDYTKENYIYMDTVIYFNRKGRDDNNIYKLLCDSLEGIVYDNDSRVLIRTEKILYDTENPRVEVYVHPVEYIGIFDDQEDLDNFESVCKGCKRYARNCSILKSAKEGRVQKEINEDVCSKFSANAK